MKPAKCDTVGRAGDCGNREKAEVAAAPWLYLLEYMIPVLPDLLIYQQKIKYTF